LRAWRGILGIYRLGSVVCARLRLHQTRQQPGTVRPNSRPLITDTAQVRTEGPGNSFIRLALAVVSQATWQAWTVRFCLRNSPETADPKTEVLDRCRHMLASKGSSPMVHLPDAGQIGGSHIGAVKVRLPRRSETLGTLATDSFAGQSLAGLSERASFRLSAASQPSKVAEIFTAATTTETACQ
jgi:hypothetical protein